MGKSILNFIVGILTILTFPIWFPILFVYMGFLSIYDIGKMVLKLLKGESIEPW